MRLKQLHPISAKAIDPAICPNIRARAPVLAQLKVVEVRRVAKLQHEDEFVLRAIESPHPRVRFGPNADVFEQELETGARLQQLAHMPPVDAHKQDRPIKQYGEECLEEVGKEPNEGILRQLAGGHREISMACLAESGDKAIACNVLGR